MDKKQPERLTNEQFMPPSASFEIFHTTLEGSTRLHWHEFYEVSFILKGEGVHFLNGMTYQVKPGNIFLLTPADFHELISLPGADLDIFNVIFSDEMLDEELRKLIFNDIELLMADFTDDGFLMIKSEYQRMWTESKQGKPGHRIVLQGALERVLIELARACLGNEIQDNKPFRTYQQPSVRKALIYLQHHFREDLTLKDVAKQAQFAPNYFSECFRNAVGTTFQNHLQELRINFAKSLLNVSELSVTEICFASGFNTLSHFERVFKQKFGQSPREFRKT